MSDDQAVPFGTGIDPDACTFTIFTMFKGKSYALCYDVTDQLVDGKLTNDLVDHALRSVMRTARSLRIYGLFQDE
jgi:hypothetical protein